MKAIKNIFLSVVLVFSTVFILQAAVPGVSNAQLFNNAKQQACQGTDLDNSGNCGPGQTSQLNNLLKNALNILSVIIGVVAVIMIIIGGFRYITSAGDSARIGSAKNTIIYALIGLVIVALAQFIVYFVLRQTDKAVNSQNYCQVEGKGDLLKTDPDCK